MGSVYLAESPTGARVAVKVVRPELACDDAFRARFRGEVRQVRRVPPFCTAEVLDAAADHDPPYLVVEYIDGPSLAEVIRENGPLTGSRLHGLAIGVTTALAAIHDAGIVHRDLKPGNVLLSPVGGPKVIDFGVAKSLGTTSHHTSPGQFFGTVAYMGPERFRPDAHRHVDTSADIFAWGAVVTYAATGQTPYVSETVVAAAAGVPLPAPELSALPELLRGLVARALEADPAHRPTAHQLLEELLSAGDASVRTSLRTQPDVRRAAAAVRRTEAFVPVAETGLATLEQPLRAGRRRLPSRSVMTVAAAALAAGFLAYPATSHVVDRSATPAASPTGVLPAVIGRAADDKASRAERKDLCALGGPLEATPRDPHAYECPAVVAAGDQVINAEFTLAATPACAAVWTHVTGTGSHRVAACPDRLTIVQERGRRLRTVATWPLDHRLLPGDPHHLLIATVGARLTVSLDDRSLLTTRIPPPEGSPGAVVFGAVGDTGGAVTFRDVSVARP
ncbi:serine/threonine protein kinase [Actinoplanes sp. LDG1-06]|uniref:Serine/threonine protein kinase n=2 Tax=Paractinoplanes ovalisporus TaxID=2810368 RepID=A0ABS2A6Z2_9ACTN|nr:serine/threonine protein kinase [Actinoplanes ovalisporus]